MKNIKPTIAKSLLVIALFCPPALADGDQGSGGLTESGATDVSSCETTLDGDQGSGGLTEIACEDSDLLGSILSSIYDYFDGMG